MASELLSLVKEVRASGPQGCGAFLTVNGEQELSIFEGSEPAGPESLWALGSVTTTVTATALAALTIDGTVTLDTTVGRVLGSAAGAIADRTLRELATHTSGLPRLPSTKGGFLRKAFTSQPYANLDEPGLLEAMARVKPEPAGVFAYSNFGYLVLGLALSQAASLPLPALLHREVLDPLGLQAVRVGEEAGDDDAHLPGYSLGRPKPRWVHPLPACGGIAATVPDLRTWAEANLDPDSTPIGEALRLAQAEHRGPSAESSGGGLGWMFGRTPDTVWHNGAESGSYALVVIDRSLSLAFGFVANCWTAREPETTVNAWLRRRIVGLTAEES
jgi:CubicO group peptidase (beta-lactamase class C family)